MRRCASATRIIEFTSHTTGMSRYAWRSVQPPARRRRSEIAATLADADVAAQLATGDVVVVAGRGNLAESQSSAMAALRAVLDAVPGRRVCCRPCGAATSSAPCSSASPRPTTTTTRLGHAACRGRRQARPAGAARRRPDQRLPRCRPRPPRAGRRSPDRLDRHVHVRFDAAGRPRAGGGRRSASRPAPRPTSRVACSIVEPDGHGRTARRDPTG